MADIEQATERARDAFGRYAESDDKGELSACRETCRQLKGVLEILGASGSHMLCQEIVNLLDALIQARVTDLATAKDAIAEGMLQLSEYLKHLQEGYADLPVIILPTLNNLRAARDIELLSEHMVFLPEEGHAGNDLIGTDEYVSLSADRLQQVTTKLRFFMQKALLGWFRNEQPQRMLQAAGKVTDNMIRLNHSRRLRSLWWIGSGLAAALESGRLEHGVTVKMLMGRLEREIRHFGELGEERYDHALPDELIKNLLYYIGLAESGTETTDKVKAAYHLDVYLPKGETLTELRQYYTTPGRDLWRAVSTSVTDELHSLQGILDGMQDQARQPELLGKLADKSESLSSTLAMLGLGRAAELTTSLVQDLKAKAASGETQDFDAMLQISTHYAKLEKILAEYAETGDDLTDTVFSQDGDALDPSGERSLLRTTLTELSKAQARTVAFYKEGWAFVCLEEVITSLENISGALKMVDANELLPLADTALRYVKEDLLANGREPSQEELSTFADVLTLFEASVSARLQHEDYLSLLPTGFDKLRELDSFSQLDLLGDVDLDGVEAELEAKKKAQQIMPANLYQRFRHPTFPSLATA
ncbi:hypothetical protein VSS37_13720 [Candidatus Thiothrix sp. Deng01]|uniref:Scaffold protein FimL second domain-containing protein n=1 Tax=Candidatus Thiothrix phosphatis TaxID=3112415 RepID=A0ABU6CYY9_9GAMM|nr:hypothetical protein [Candidatus Thiothrix sp. Deng01]MEB4592047.1 hypothetical protein [Candidatus Thiothrix sp. Deng01]